MIKYVTKCAICVDCLVYGTNPASNINCCRILRFYLDIVMGKVRLSELVIKGGVFEKWDKTLSQSPDSWEQNHLCASDAVSAIGSSSFKPFRLFKFFCQGISQPPLQSIHSLLNPLQCKLLSAMSEYCLGIRKISVSVLWEGMGSDLDKNGLTLFVFQICRRRWTDLWVPLGLILSCSSPSAVFEISKKATCRQTCLTLPLMSLLLSFFFAYLHYLPMYPLDICHFWKGNFLRVPRRQLAAARRF